MSSCQTSTGCRASASAALVLGLLAGCDGRASFLMHSTADATGAVTDQALAPVVGMRRLSRAEVVASIKDLLNIDAPEAFVVLPEDAGGPFDNDYTVQQPSQVLIEAADVLATGVAARAVASPITRERLIPCAPSAPGDEVCLRKVIATFGRRALRRPLTAAEIDDLVTFKDVALETGRFEAGVELVVRALLEDVEFLYRVEVGAPVEGQPGASRLNAFELASRLSFFLWGRTPPDWLLDLAEAGQLASAEQVRSAAAALLEDARSKAQLERFHAMWLGYAGLPYAADLSAALTAETSALVDKVVFEDKSDYFQLFLSNQTWANDLLVQHYGLSAPSAPGFRWVSYAGAPRMGVLSQGALLSNGAKQLDTSPTRRGKWIRNQLFCQEIPPPPPNANADVPPTSTTGSVCKRDRYQAHASVGSCATCHSQMDPVGFGLENFDREGKYRTQEPDNPSCAISGEGELSGVGPFQGAVGLATLLTRSGQLEPCVVRQVFRFATGRRELGEDLGLLDSLEASFVKGGRRFDQLLLDFVSGDTFAVRREEE